jgi:O-antigen/teichoic acid export membrane protein
MSRRTPDRSLQDTTPLFLVQIHKSVAANVISGAWLGILIVTTTPWFIKDLGLEGFGLIGIWQLIFYVSLILDGGLGASCSRELSRYRGLNLAPYRFRHLFALFERPILLLGLTIVVLITTASNHIATQWLDMRTYPIDEVATAVRWMAVSVSLQFVAAFYLNVLTGLQRMGVMSAMQVFNNSVKYLGGAVVLALSDGILTFFVFQAVAAGIGLLLVRWIAVRSIGVHALDGGIPAEVDSLRRHMTFSGGMFFTAACGALVSNADRMVVSKMMTGEDLGKYMVALTAIGLLQTLVFAFHRAYFPRFCELHAAGDQMHLKAAYYGACRTVGTILIPLALLVVGFTPELFRVWLGWAKPDMVELSRWLLLGFTLSGVMWLPAAYQQAIGWTRLHASLMAVTLLVGVPLTIMCVHRLGLVGASALMIAHGVVEITAGLWIMNKVCFPGENLLWYRCVIVGPLLVGLPVVVLSRAMLPHDLGRVELAVWIIVTVVAQALAVLGARRLASRSKLVS